MVKDREWRKDCLAVGWYGMLARFLIIYWKIMNMIIAGVQGSKAGFKGILSSEGEFNGMSGLRGSVFNLKNFSLEGGCGIYWRLSRP